jgi:hypothetical protein
MYEDQLQSIQSLEAIKYGIDGREVSANDSLHHQCVFKFSKRLRPSAVKKLLIEIPGWENAHIEVTKYIDAAIEYCKKEGDFTEWGQKVDGGYAGTHADASKRKRSTLSTTKFDEQAEHVREAIEKGDFDEIPASFELRYGPQVHKWKQENIAQKLKSHSWDPMKDPDDGGSPHMWIHGPRGSGKSSLYAERLDDCYILDATTRGTTWFDGWTDQHRILIFDDFDKYGVSRTPLLKIATSHAPFRVQIKGAMLLIRPDQIIVTSNYTIDEIWSEHPRDVQALCRRFNQFEKKTLSSPFEIKTHTKDFSFNETPDLSFPQGFGLLAKKTKPEESTHTDVETEI